PSPSLTLAFLCFFFFSSRRRHTRFSRDWSSDVCSSDLEQRWRLQAPATLERLADGRLLLGPQCWRSSNASLCGEGEQRLLPEPSLRYRLRDFDLTTLARWLPADFAWQGELNGDVELDLPEAGPQGRVRLDAGRGSLRVRESGEWLDFPYQALFLDGRLQPEQVDLQARFDGGELGELRLD